MSDSAEGPTRTGRPVAGSPSPRGRRGRPRDPGVDVAIRTATVDLLGEIGYARLTMDKVAARAGVSKASLYLRWPNKVALVADALQQRARAVPQVPDTGAWCGADRTGSSPGCAPGLPVTSGSTGRSSAWRSSCSRSPVAAA